MYEYLSGTLAARTPSHVCIDVNGVGYRVEIPLSTYEKLPRSGAVKLHTWLKVSDDALRLYGFATERERDFFVRLVESVGQLGPAKALALLSSTGIDDLTRAIEEGDVATLRRVKGIGEKLASRLVVDLKGKLPADLAGKAAAGTSLSKDAVTALQGLGYDRSEAEEAVRKALRDLPAEPPLEDVIKRSLANV
ncbi:MAG: Holliday junction branch migration protein RuvA [Planctomycetes bacterium]|nr:Holliday junction branch migration protein RuvA [Planctomycetota bacterium]